MSLLNDWADEAYANSYEHGFWDDAPKEDAQALATYIGNKLMLIVGEVAEAHECLRDNVDPHHTWQREDGKPEGLAFEIADVMIRLFDLAGALDLDLDFTLRTKAAFNANRPPMHGKAF